MMKRLYVTDLDGTLLNKESKISRQSKHILNAFIRKGGCLTYATARSYASARVVTEGVNFHLPSVIYNGTFIYDIVRDTFLHSEYFTEQNIIRLKDISRAFHFTPLIYTFLHGEEKILWNRNGNLSDGFLYYLSRRKADKRMLAVDSLEESLQGNIFYVTFIEDKEELQPLYELVKAEAECNVVFQQEIYRTEYWCEIMPKTVDKARAVRLLKDILRCDELVVFGDSLNDVPMFEIADYSYAVSNANDRLKQIATKVIGYNDEDSVALALAEMENL